MTIHTSYVHMHITDDKLMISNKYRLMVIAGLTMAVQPGAILMLPPPSTWIQSYTLMFSMRLQRYGLICLYVAFNGLQHGAISRYTADIIASIVVLMIDVLMHGIACMPLPTQLVGWLYVNSN